MSTENILAKLKEAIIADLRLEDITADTFDENAPLFGDEGLGLDSLDAVELVVLVERHFGVVITDAEQAKTIFTSATALAQHIAANKS